MSQIDFKWGVICRCKRTKICIFINNNDLRTGSLSNAIEGECEGEGKGGQTRVLLVKRAL